jgi:hypothetical protein
MLEAVLMRRLAPEAAVARAADMIGAVTGLPVERAAAPAGGSDVTPPITASIL